VIFSSAACSRAQRVASNFFRFSLALWLLVTGSLAQPASTAKRVLILKVDGLNADLLFRTMGERNPETGKSRLPWFTEIFSHNGVIFDNFYTRGISLSAPSWSMLDTGHHLVIKGNVEYDRYTGRVYDYLNFFPFYLGYARNREVDMPSVRVLDEAGTPLLIDSFPYDRRYQSFQLFQRGVQWTTLQQSLKRRLTTHALLSVLEDPQGGLGLGEGLEKQIENEVLQGLSGNKLEYIDLFTGNIDHAAHSINDPHILTNELVQLDAVAGRLWSAVEKSPLADETLFVVVSDHGMNNVPQLYSQTLSLPDLLNSPAGGAHHVITNRHQLSNYKLAGLDPLVFRVINPSTASFYLRGQENEYPTAWLDLDGNERSGVSLRNSGLNRIHIVLEQLARSDLRADIRKPAVRYLEYLIAKKRRPWEAEIQALAAEMGALGNAIVKRQAEMSQQPKRWTADERELGLDKVARRKAAELSQWITEKANYENYIRHLRNLITLDVGDAEPMKKRISDLIPRLSLGDPNSLYDLQHYVVGPAALGLTLDAAGTIDEARSFRHVDYFPLFAAQTVRNNPQAGISSHPIDFAAMALPPDQIASHFDKAPGRLCQAIWLYGNDEHQLLELVVRDGEAMRIRAVPVAHLTVDQNGSYSWQTIPWQINIPLRLFEDDKLALPANVARSEWLNEWHSEHDWFQAVHECRYSNGVIGITEELLPPSLALPGQHEKGLLGQLEIERRELVQPDLILFAADHWNFNVRNFNPGGNHGSFLRISTHSVWMMAGAGLPPGAHIEDPYDSLNFAPTILSLLGKAVPIQERVVQIAH
jgi:hypothetical protein